MTLYLKYTVTNPMAIPPRRTHEDSVCFDVFSPKSFMLLPEAVVKIDTYIIFEMQGSFYAQLVDVPNTNLKLLAGVIDPGYRGSIIVALKNLTDAKQFISTSDIIAKMIFLPVLLPELIYDDFDEYEGKSLQLYVKFTKTHPAAFKPTRLDEDSVGYDLYAIEDTCVPPYGTKHIDIGLSLHIDAPLYGQIRDKSGFSTKKELYVINGVIDSSYKSSIIINFKNLSNKTQYIFFGETIAQLIFYTTVIPKLKYADEINMNTYRGDRGFESGNRRIC